MNEQNIHQERTIRISRFLSSSLNIKLFVLILFFITGPLIVQAQDELTPGAPSRHEDSPGAVTLPTCELPPIVVPTLPDKIPGYAQLDPETRLHVTGTPQVIDLESYYLEITGKVKHPLKLKYDNLRCMPKIEDRPTLVCPGFFEDTATWAGASLKYVLELAGVQEGASRIRLVSADGYTATVSMELALSKKNFLAYEWERKPIPILHGFPVRAVFPYLQGNEWVKWLIRIEVQ